MKLCEENASLSKQFHPQQNLKLTVSNKIFYIYQIAPKSLCLARLPGAGNFQALGTCQRNQENKLFGVRRGLRGNLVHGDPSTTGIFVTLGVLTKASHRCRRGHCFPGLSYPSAFSFI